MDAVIPAIGQETDWACLTDECACTLSDWGTMQVDPVTLQSSDADIFAGGDAVTGPATVVEAIGAGKEAAISIDRFIRGEDLAAGRKIDWTPVQDVPVDGLPTVDRHPMATLAPEMRVTNFNEVQLGFDQETARAEANRCLECGVCCECYQCVTACKAEAVTLETHSQKPETLTIETGAIILAPGFQPFDPSKLDTYSYNRFPNVITSMEMERILSATGPTSGHLVRPSDQQEPKKVAWLQCVGSRDLNRCDNEYCSSVCCMYAIKEAVIAKEHAGEGLRTVHLFHGHAHPRQGFRKILQPRQGQRRAFCPQPGAHHHPGGRKRHPGHGVRHRRGRTGRGKLRHGGAVGRHGGLRLRRVDGQCPGDRTQSLQLRQDRRHLPVATSRPGIYVAGVIQGCKDIPQSVMEASAAACGASIDLAQARGSLVRTQEFPDESDTSQAEPRIGVFVCNCGVNIGGIANVPAIAEYARALPNVAYVEENLFTCSQDTQDKIVSVIKENNLNRIVVAACTPRTHEPLFQETIRNAGLNPYLFEMANIRNQCTWVHSADKGKATDKSKDLVRMAVARASLLESIPELSVAVNKSALVIGGGQPA